MQLSKPPEHGLIVSSAVEERVTKIYQEGVFIIRGEIGSVDVSTLMISLTAPVCGVEKPLWIILDSNGGDAIQAFGLYDSIMAAREKGFVVNVLSVGFVASAALLVLQAATRRYSWPNTQFLIHQISIYFEMDQRVEANQQQENAKATRKLNSIVLKLIADRIGMPINKLAARTKNTDCWLSPQEALRFGTNGLIDEVITGFPF
jgi:ATP-dependent protease ClpP protease subunit